MSFSSKQAILFDNDGVLTHTESFWLRVNSEVMESLHIPYTKQDFIVHTFDEGWGTKGWLAQAGYDEEIQTEFKTKRNERVRLELLENTTADPLAESIISKLRESFTLAVVTNTNGEFLKLLSEKFPFLNYFDAHIVRSDYAEPKPAPDGYIAALATLGLPPEQAVVVEDSPRGIAAANAAGLEVIGIRNPDFPELDLSAATTQVESLKELAQLF